MQNEFVFLNLSTEQLTEIHRALLARFLMEETIRREQGLEPAPYPALVIHLESLLALAPDQAHAILHQLEDELWQHSWYSYTDEWAWFRARQDALKHLGKQAARTSTQAMEQKIESAYQENFERYVSEVDMHEEKNQKAKIKSQKSKSKGKR